MLTASDAYSIETLAPIHWEAVARIYSEGIASGQATFEESVPAWEAWNQAHLPQPRIVAMKGSEVLGWAALSPVSRRAAYAGVAEVSIYVAQAHHGRGIGRGLLEELIALSEQQGLWTLQAGIFAVNAASRSLHRSCGFREVGLRERIGQLQGVWQNVILMERRSLRIGASGTNP